MIASARIAVKVNWDLRVLGRRDDGFHELRSWFLAVEGGDSLRAEPAGAAAAGLTLSGDRAADAPAGADNLVLRAEAAWREAFPADAARVPPLRWTLDKRVPAGAGLGGGSGDAAAALLLLERLAGHAGAARAALDPLAARLGSDVPFFLRAAGAAELRGGRGERLLACAAPPAPWLVLAIPPCAVATARAFAALRAPAWRGPDPAVPAAPGESPGPNDLAEAAARVEPSLAAWRARAAAAAGTPLAMSGSGAAHFLPSADGAGAALLRDRLVAAGIPARAAAACPGAAVEIRMGSGTP